jgi:hypothetical protein
MIWLAGAAVGWATAAAAKRAEMIVMYCMMIFDRKRLVVLKRE